MNPAGLDGMQSRGDGARATNIIPFVSDDGWLTRERPALICFSHLRWDFVYQRPQHLLSRFAKSQPVFYFEEPIPTDGAEAFLERRMTKDGVCVLVPRLPAVGDHATADAQQRRLLDAFMAEQNFGSFMLWYYTPMSLAFSSHLEPSLLVYDCMDELSAFRGAPPQLVERERELMSRADVVFTGGYSLYEAKRRVHVNAHAFPSSVDVGHFRAARADQDEPQDQRTIAHPRLGFYGVLDERFDIDLVADLAAQRPDWQIVLVGPIVKIDPATLPRAANIHYLGSKSYEQLPAYLGGWDVALMPFAMNESTRFISPTKTPEYLAGGKPVVSTPIMDVVRTYGHTDLVHIASNAKEFVTEIEAALKDAKDSNAVRAKADAILGEMSWDKTWEGMRDAINRAHRARVLDASKETTGAAVTRLDPSKGSRAGKTASTPRYDYLIVGAGFAGAVLAERLAAGSNKRVLVVDKRPHIAGNAYDHYNEDGLLVHKYGPHIFHTNSDKVVDYLSRFTQWRPYEHRVLAQVDDQLVPMPINLTTLSRLYGREFTADDAQAFLAARAEKVDTIKTSEDVVVSQIGRELYEKFFQGYTRKQWGLDPSELDKSVAARVPTRTSIDDRYFTDSFQNMPLHGYTKMFENMLNHPNISVMTGTDFQDLEGEVQYDKLIYTGPIDEFFKHRFGKLPYRSLRFEHTTLPVEKFQQVGTVNYPAEATPYTRITEYKHLTGQQHAKTSLTYEYPMAEGDPYYPVPRPENQELYRRYQALADATPNVVFVGRLACYRYYNMDQVVAQALSTYQQLQQEDAARSAALANAPAAVNDDEAVYARP